MEQLKWRNVGRKQYEAKVGVYTLTISAGQRVAIQKRPMWDVKGNVGDLLDTRYYGSFTTLKKAQEAAAATAERKLAAKEAKMPKSEVELLREALEKIMHITSNAPDIAGACEEIVGEVNVIAHRTISKIDLS